MCISSLSYEYSTCIATFRLILVLIITPEHTLHSRVNNSITQLSYCLQILREDLYVTVNFAPRVL